MRQFAKEFDHGCPPITVRTVSPITVVKIRNAHKGQPASPIKTPKRKPPIHIFCIVSSPSGELWRAERAGVPAVFVVLMFDDGMPTGADLANAATVAVLVESAAVEHRLLVAVVLVFVSLQVWKIALQDKT